MNSPPRPTDAQRWLRFMNAGTDVIPPFAVAGPQMNSGGLVDAVESSSEVDFSLRLGRPDAAVKQAFDASLLYVNGPQEIQPKRMGRCTQTGMMQALIGYPKSSPPAWGDGLSIDPAHSPTPFYLVPGSGGYRFIDFDGCPRTTFQDAARSGYAFRVGWIVPASPSTAFDGVVIKDNGTLATLEAGKILPLSGRDNPTLAMFGLSDRLSTSTETTSLRARGFHRVRTTGSYLLNFTARIRSTDSDININVSGNLKLICRTNRVHNTDAFHTADQIEAMAADGDLGGDDYAFHQLRVGAEDQPADTNQVEGEVVEKHRHWQTVSGSTVLSLTAGELLFIYNPTGYTLEVSGVSATLVLLSGATSGGSSPTSSMASRRDDSDSSSASPIGEEVGELGSRVTSVESELNTLEAAVTTQATTISSHTASIASNSGGISGNAASITGHASRLVELETFEASVATAIAANTSAISENATDIAASAAAIAVNAGSIGALQTFQATATATLAAHASDMDDLEAFQATTEAIFAGAIADGTITTATGDAITTAGGVVTSFTQGPVTLPGNLGTNRQFLKSNGAGSSSWTNVVHQYWSENGGGHLVADTNNVRDIGTPSTKVRSIYIGTSATIDGTLTVGGANIAAQLSSLGSMVAANASDIDDVQTAPVVGRSGLRLSRISNTQLKVATGYIHNHNHTVLLGVSLPITLDLSDSGDLVNGSGRATATWYHVLIGTETSTGNVVAGLSTTLAQPSGWDDWQMLGAIQTNTTGSGEIVPFEQHGDEFIATEEIILLSDTTPGSSEITQRAWCPPGNYAVVCQLRSWGGSGSAYIVLRNTPGGSTVDAGYIQAATPMNWPARATTDSSGNIYILIGAAITFSEFRVHGKTFIYPIGEAAHV